MMATTKPKPKNDTPKPTTHKMEVVNVGPIHQFSFEASVGVNEVRGGNEKGKSNLTSAIANQLGADMPVRVTDGETEGLLKRDGVVVATFKRPKGKQPYVSLASTSPVALVVDPGIKGAASAEEVRLRNLVSMTGLKTTQETVELFLTPEPRSSDEEPEVDRDAFDYVEEHYGVENLLKLDPVAAADVLVKGAGGLIHKLRREFEKAADEAQGRYEPPGEKVESDQTVEEAQADYEEAIGDEREMRGSVEQRKQREEEREQIKATLGDRPDVQAAEQTTVDTQAELDEAVVKERELRDEIRELERKLTAHMELVGALDRTAKEAARTLTKTERAAEEWERRKAILDSEISGPTEGDLQEMQQSVEMARQRLETARRAELYQKQLAAAEQARKDRDEARKREAAVKRLGESVPGRLGDLFGEAGIPGARVVDGVLELKNTKNKWEPFERRSAGAKWRWALPIWVEHNPEGMLVLCKEAWNELDRESQVEIADIFVAHNVIGFVEVTTSRDDPLHVKPFNG